jgi:hypothetical protein
MRNISGKNSVENNNTRFICNKFVSFPANHAVCDINVEKYGEPDRPQVTM